MRLALLSVLTFALVPSARAQEVVINPLGRPVDSTPVRLRAPVPAVRPGQPMALLADGQPTIFDREPLASGGEAVWVSVSLPPADRASPFPRVSYAWAPGREPFRGEPLVSMTQEGGMLVLDNRTFAVRVPLSATGTIPPGPIASIRLPDGRWVGTSTWSPGLKLTSFRAVPLTQGQVLGRVRLEYGFDDGGVPRTAAITVTVEPGVHHAKIEEELGAGEGAWWEFSLTEGWNGRQPDTRIYGGGAGRGADASKWPQDLKPGPTTLEALRARHEQHVSVLGDTLVRLLPRWNQHYDLGWWFGVHDGATVVGAIPAFAGQWVWPHENELLIKARPSGDYAGVRGAARRGSRTWLLAALPARAGLRSQNEQGRWQDPLEGYARIHAMYPLDKLHRDFDLEWPGQTGAVFPEFFSFSSNINPTGGWRGRGRSSVAEAGRPGGLGQWIEAQNLFHPDTFGSYDRFWSPQNPNFHTDYIKVPLGLAARCKAHPRFERLRALAELRLRQDVDHAVTLPGGAGQECPGYLHHSLRQYQALAPLVKEHLGFDLTAWPRVSAGEAFLLTVSAPNGRGGRISHPGGDTHPPGPAISGSVRGRPSEEVPGFGAVLRNRPDTPQETYVAFKSGPNRGHYHGDQLSLHLAFGGRLSAVDHHCSYNPRAGQEHMHNRVAFFTDDLPYANQDGYERLIAFATTPTADIAVGDVRSPRLRDTTAFPPERWDQREPSLDLGGELVYRRTLVLLKGETDALVIYDQFESPRPIHAAYALHVRGGKADQAGDAVQFDDLVLYMTGGRDLPLVRHDWQHENGGLEATRGVRFERRGVRSGSFLSVLSPAPGARVESIPGGLRVNGLEVTVAEGLTPAADAAVVTVARSGQPLAALRGRDIDLNRSQGEVGLFVPDAGYPFGPIPDWLSRQRVPVSTRE